MKNTVKTFSLALAGLLLLLLAAAPPTLAKHSHLTGEPPALALTEAEKAWLAAHPRIVLGTDRDWRPYVVARQEGVVDGLEADILARINQLAGTGIEIVLGEWADMVEMAEKREIDGLAMSAYHKERAGHFLFTESPYSAFKYIYTLASTFSGLNSMEDLAGRRVALQRGNRAEEKLLQRQAGITPVLADNSEEMLAMLLSGRVDAVISSINFRLLAREKLRPEVQIAFAAPDSEIKLLYSIRKDWPELVSIINKALAAIPRREIQALKEKWGVDSISLPAASGLKLTADEQAWLKDHPVIEMTTDQDSPPFQFMGSDGMMSGILADYISALEKQLGIKVQLNAFPGSERYESVVRGDDLITGFTLAQDLTGDWPYQATAPVLTAYLSLFGTEEQGLVLDPAEIKGKTIALSGEAPEVDVIEKLKRHNRLLFLKSNTEMIGALLSGQADYALEVAEIFKYFLKQSQISSVREVFTWREPFEAVFLVHQDEPILLSIVNKAIAEIERQELPTILNKWHGRKISARLQLTAAERSWLAAHPVIELHTERDSPPYQFVTGDGTMSGILGDYLVALEKRLGVSFKVISSPQGEQLKQVDQGKALMAGFVVEELLPPGGPVRPSDQVLQGFFSLFSRQAETIVSPETLRDKTIAVLGNDLTWDQLTDLGRHNHILKFAQSSELVGALLSGQADYAIELSPIFHFYLYTTQTSGLHEVYTWKTPVTGLFAVHEDAPQLLSSLNKAIADIARNELPEILSKWYHKRATTPVLTLTTEERTWLKEHPVIRVMGEEGYPPWDFLADGKPAGYSIDYVQLLLDRLGITPEYVVAPYGELIEKTVNRELDLMHTAQAGLHEDILPSTAYSRFFQVAFTRKQRTEIGQVADLAGKRVAAVKGDAVINSLQAVVPGVEVVPFEDYPEALLALYNGEVDAAVMDNAVGNYLINKHLLYGLKTIGEVRAGADDPYADMRLGVRSDWPELLTMLEKAMASVTEQELDALNRKWLSKLEEEMPDLGLSDTELQWLKEHPVIRIGADADWAPIEFRGDDGNFHGLAIDYLNRIAPMLGVRFEFVHENWQELISLAKQQQLDLFTGAAKTPARDKFLLFTEPYVEIPAGIFAKQEVAYISDFSKLYGQKVAVGEGYASHDELAANHPEIELVLVKNPEEGIHAVLNGEALAYIDNVTTTSHLIRHQGHLGIKMVGEAPFIFSLRMGVRKDWPQLQSILQKALASIPVAERNALYNRWVPLVAESPTDYSLVWKIGIAAAMAMLLLIVWIRLLRRQVKRHTAALREANRELEKSEQRYSLAQQAANIGSWDRHLATGRLHWSPEVQELFGYAPGEFDGTYDAFISRVHPKDRKRVEQAISTTEKDDVPYDIEYRILLPDATERWVAATGRLFRDAAGKAVRMLGVMQDITARKRTESLLQSRITLTELTDSHTETELLQVTLDEAEAVTGSQIGFFHFVDDNQESLHLQTWSTNTLKGMCTAEAGESHYAISQAGVWVDCVRQRKPVIHNDYASLTHKKGLPPGHAPVIRELVVPVIIGDKIHAIMGVGNKQTNYTSEDVEAVLTLASMAWETISRKRAEEALRRAHDLLEQKVSERTASLQDEVEERRRIERELKQSIDDLERFNSFSIDREEQMIALKDEVNELLQQLGKQQKYWTPQ